MLDNPANERLKGAFNDCLKELRSWRGQHVAVVSRYAVQPARALMAASQQNNKGGKPPANARSGILPFLQDAKKNSVGIGEAE